MRLLDIFLFEAPLPPDWDVDIYDQRIPFAQRVRYAVERAQKLGTGSSRVVFNIPYQGRSTALKIAKNRKGMVQNQEEASLFEDWYLNSLGITIPMIDYDERNSQPTWIHTERAQKIRPSQFKMLLAGTDLYTVINALEHARRNNFSYRDNLSEATKETELFNDLQDLIMNYDMIKTGDIARPANWGLYKGNPVIVDLGFTTESAKLYQ